MDVFKTEVGIKESILISEENYSNATNGDKRYWRKNKKNVERYYAVCPLCDNPIQIIGLFKEHHDGRKPYGKHNKGDIEELAAYDEDAYLSCPYSHPNQPKEQIRRQPDSKSGYEIWNLLLTQFDRIVYIWNRTTGIRMSEAFAGQLLKIYIANEGWQFYNSNRYNLPFMLIYAERAYPLINRWIRKESAVYTILKQNGSVRFEEIPGNGSYVIVKRKGSHFADISFYLTRHKPEITEEHPNETFDIVVTESGKKVGEYTIDVSYEWLDRLMEIPEDKAKRNHGLLDAARRIMQGNRS